MKKLLFILLIAFTLLAFRPGPTKPPPVETKPPPPVETLPPPPIETKPPAETKPPPVETQPPPEITEPPEHGVTPEPNKPKSKAENEPREIRLPSGGYGPQEAPANQTPWALAIVCACVLGLGSILLALFVGAWLKNATRGTDPKEWDE
jgi:outer membrane biosynthesis protein TonB